MLGKPKKCARCGVLKPLEDFNRLTKSPDGRQWNCRACNAAWHADNKAHQNKLIQQRNRRVRRENQLRLLEYLQQHPCVDCGETDPLVLDFDHVRDKVAAVTRIAWTSTWTKVRAEIEKCEVRCANCHRRVTASRDRTFRWRSAMADE